MAERLPQSLYHCIQAGQLYEGLPPQIVAVMIALDNSTQLKHSTNHSRERRVGTATTMSPPSYEAVLVADHAPAVTSDEKKGDDQPLRIFHSNDSSQTQTSTDGRVYSETPSAFSRIPVVGSQSFKAFSPMEVKISGSAKSLDKGLPSGIPQTSAVPHPFEQRDIGEADWNRFIQDLRDGTALPKCLGRMMLVPAIIGMGPGAYFLNKALKAKSRGKKLRYAISIINTWNQSFFVPRRVEVVLMRGETKLTTAEPIAASQKFMSHGNQSFNSVPRDIDSTSKGYHCCRQSRVPLRLVVLSIAETAENAMPTAP